MKQWSILLTCLRKGKIILSVIGFICRESSLHEPVAREVTQEALCSQKGPGLGLMLCCALKLVRIFEQGACIFVLC